MNPQPNALALTSSPNARLLAGIVNKDRAAQVAIFVRWLDDNGRRWWETDLREYRDYLLTEYRTTQTQRPLSKVSASKYVEAVRRRYHALATDNSLLDALYAAVPTDMSPADREAEITRLLRYVNNNANVEHNRIKLPTIKHQTDQETVRLTFAQAYALAEGIGGKSLRAIRDRAIVAFLFATGLRVDELCALVRSDLEQTAEGRAGVLVRHGKGNVQRFVIFVPELEPLLRLTDDYMAFIDGGYVFRPFESRHCKRLLNEAISKRSVQALFEGFGMHAHQARHSYARMLNIEFGYSMAFVQEQLAHESEHTTRHYVGKRDDVRFDELDQRA